MNTTNNNYEAGGSGHNPVGGALISEVQTLELVLAVSIFVAIRSLRQRSRHGLPSWPVVGMLPSLLPALRGNVYEWITEVLIARGGTFTFRGPWLSSMTAVLTSDPRNLEHLLKTNFPSFPKGDYFRTNVRDLLGGGIFAADHEAWRRQRRTASLEFHSSAFRALTTESLVELVHARLLPLLDSACADRRDLDLQDVLLRLTFDNVCILAFGTDPGCLSPGGLPEVPFARAFEDATEATTLRFVTPTTLWKMLKFFDIGFERRLKKALKEVDLFAYRVIRARKEELAAGSASRSDLLTAFMRLRGEDGEEFSEKFLRDICVNFILAGRDTSSVALAWFFWLLESNGEVEEKIVEEVRRMVEERGRGAAAAAAAADDDHVVFKPEEVKRMDYLNAALSEALRLYPSVPVDNKQVAQDEVFPDGTVLKKGTKVIYSMYTMGRMESIWGKDCREYRPERWLKADGRYASESAYKFTAFNGGPRLCLGKDFAYYQMKFVAASILYRYRVRVVENHPVAPKLALTMYMKHGLKVTLSRRNE